MPAFFDRVKCYALTRGTGPISCGPALTGNLGLADYEVVNGTQVTYLMHDVGGAWEIGYGTYVNNFITRDQLIASSTGELLNLTGSAIVACQPSAQDYYPFEARSLDPIPMIADFSIQNIANGVTFTDTPGGILCTVPAGQGFASATLFKALPATPVSVCCRFKQLSTMHQFSSFDLIVLNNSNGRCEFMEVSSRLNETSNQWQLGYFMGRDNSLSSFNATIYSQTLSCYPLWYRFDVSGAGGLLAAFVSPDGYSWIGMGEDWSSNFVGNPTHVGFGGASSQNPSYFLVSAFTNKLPV